MATPTVINPRARALAGRIGRLDAEPARREAVALGLVDALLEGDHESLAAALDALRDARVRAGDDEDLAGWLDAAIAFAYWGLERVPSPAALTQGTQAHDFLGVLDGSPALGSTELRRLLEIDETQVSRTGRRLLDAGLVTRSKVGRQAFWQLTPRGRRALADAPARQRPDHSDFWRDALRRGFEGDAPSEADPTRDRIIESALALHTSRGIQATTSREIADATGVPVETIEALFPTLDDLVRGCGRHFMESLRFPPDDQASIVFVHADSEPERVHRLVETLFDAYERGADGITAARRERDDVPALRESMEALDSSFEALVVEALRPLRPDSSSVWSVRALTDLEVWRTMREQGATPEAAVDRASTAVERWLDARPVR
jgi:AcrR family transcriptional regulator/DNA-binding transcriptional ArsR family regulator